MRAPEEVGAGGSLGSVGRVPPSIFLSSHELSKIALFSQVWKILPNFRMDEWIRERESTLSALGEAFIWD